MLNSGFSVTCMVVNILNFLFSQNPYTQLDLIFLICCCRVFHGGIKSVAFYT